MQTKQNVKSLQKLCINVVESENVHKILNHASHVIRTSFMKKKYLESFFNRVMRFSIEQTGFSAGLGSISSVFFP